MIPFSCLKNESTETEDAIRNIDSHSSKCCAREDNIDQVTNENMRILNIRTVPQINNGLYLAITLDDNKNSQFQNTENFDSSGLNNSFCVRIANVLGLSDGQYLIIRLWEKIQQQVINAPTENMVVDIETPVIYIQDDSMSTIENQNVAQEIPVFDDVVSPDNLIFNYVNFIDKFKNFHNLDGYYFNEIKSLFRLQNCEVTSTKLRRFLYKRVKKKQDYKNRCRKN